MNKVEKFLKRIGLEPDTTITHTYEFLKLVQYNAVCSVAYENLDILDHKPLLLGADDLFEKIVEKQRGGYCFEVNGLLAWFLRKTGFAVEEHFARYLRNEKTVPMRRHRVLSVLCEGDIYFCDIGIGQTAPRYPLKIETGTVQSQFGEQYKFEKDADLGWVLYDLYEGEWRPFIAFTEEKQYDIDFVQPSFYCETHPDSVFNKVPMLAIKTPDGRKAMDNRTYKVFSGNEMTYIEENVGDERFEELLNKEFRLRYKVDSKKRKENHDIKK